MKGKVLVVDDVEVNRTILTETLGDDFEIIEAGSGTEAIAMVFNHFQDLSVILLDIMMPDMSGYEVLEVLKSSGMAEGVPIIFVTAIDSELSEVKGLSLGAVDYITKPINTEIVKRRVHNQYVLKKHRDQLEHMLEEKTREQFKVRDALMDTMTALIEYRNLESGKHVLRIRRYTELLLRYISGLPAFSGMIDERDIVIITKASSIHDIGKIGIPDSILLKPQKLTGEEFEQMKSHTTLGAEVVDMLGDSINDTKYLSYSRDICIFHHERWDGTGYPMGKRGVEIPLHARVVAIADVYDALVSRRVYKLEMSHDEAVDIIKSGRGSQFDPELIDAFLDVSNQFLEIMQQYSD